MQAVILCGGLGERLRPHTEKIPKVMLELKGKPILEHVINHIKKYGIEVIVLLCGYKSDEIKNHFGNGKKFGVNINYSVEKEKLGTAGAVNNAKDLIHDDFILINGDVITDFPLDRLLNEFDKLNKAVISLVRPKSPFGVAKIENTENGVKIKNFVEKPRMNEWINAGYTVIPKDFLRLFAKNGDVETDVYPKLVKTGDLYAFLLDDKYYWKSIDTHKDLKEING
ncbi:MAG: nucleotidyltransferase family protein [Candidatus Aenigmarchaeota archaeon]|nr:nucleotidyltransferase family protein [Candidatus Aenigmarchaeota archaeon]